MSRTKCATQRLTHFFHFNGRLKTLRIHLGSFWAKQGVRTDLFQHFSIILEAFRIFVKIGLLIELDRVHENRHHHDIAAFLAFTHEAEMPLMQEPHSGDEGDFLPFHAPGFRPALHVANVRNDLHSESLTPRTSILPFSLVE